MKKIIISSFVVVVIVVTVLLVLPQPKESNFSFSLHLVVDSWSESDIDYPEEEYDFNTLTLNETYVIPLEGNADYYLREFKVVKIEENSITISTPISLSDNEDGINLHSNKTKFVIEDNSSLSLDTLLMDAGEVYDFTLIKKE